MKRKSGKGKWLFVFFVSMLFTIPTQARNYNYKDTTKTDTSKTDITKSDTSGYNYHNQTNNYMYALNISFNNIKLQQDTSSPDTTEIDTTKKDTLGFNFKRVHRSYINAYAFNGNINDGIYFQDSTMKDTSKTDTTKKDTLGYNNNSSNNRNSLAYNENSPSSKSSSSNFLLYPVKDLAQKLKEDVYLKDEQISQIQDILREYETQTYQSKGNNEGLKEAANNALKNIENILTDRQKKEWINTKDEWWASVDKELNLSPLNKNNL